MIHQFVIDKAIRRADDTCLPLAVEVVNGRLEIMRPAPSIQDHVSISVSGDSLSRPSNTTLLTSAHGQEGRVNRQSFSGVQSTGVKGAIGELADPDVSR